jgi:peptide chain release factor 1
LTRETDSFLCIFDGDNTYKFYLNEIGTHKWQRVSPTERRGRVHTSSIQVSLLKIDESLTFIKESDIEIVCVRGSGPGGQHRNTTASCVNMTHKPTGIRVRIDGRNQHQNKRLAFKILDNKVRNHLNEISDKKVAINRRNQLTKDKKRTYRVKDDLAVDHNTNKRTSLKNFIKGNIEVLHE